MGQLHEEVELVRLLERHVPRVLAESIARRATEVGAGDHARTLREARVRVRLFLDSEASSAVLAELGPDSGVRSRPGILRVEVASEADVSHARLKVRELSLALGGGAFGAQRASSAVGELARNIFQHAGKGVVTVIPFGGGSPYLTLRALDEGAGLAGLPAILAGKFRNGQGRVAKGLANVKQSASRFEVKTGSRGTTVECDIPL